MKAIKATALSLGLMGIFVFASCNNGSKNNKVTKDSTATTANTSSVPDSSFKPANIAGQVSYNRAIEATLWGMPAVSMAAIRQSLKRDLDANLGDIIYCSKVLESRHL